MIDLGPVPIEDLPSLEGIVFTERPYSDPRIKIDMALVHVDEPQLIEFFPWNRLQDKGKIGQRMFSRLLPGVMGTKHADKIAHRIHIPIETNDGCFFFQLDQSEDVNQGRSIDSLGSRRITRVYEKHHMEVGRAYSIDPRIPHKVENHGDTPRIHYIFDVLK